PLSRDGERTHSSPSLPSGSSSPVSKSQTLNSVPGTGRPTKVGADFRSKSSSCSPAVKVSQVWVSVMPKLVSNRVQPVNSRQRRRYSGVSFLMKDTQLVTCSELKSNRSEEHTSELQSRENLVCRLLLE